MESQAQLQRDLQRAKQEVREAQEALETHNDETAELQEAAEMAALDKEMAEERAEALQMELEQCREKLEEATLDLQLMKAEMEAGGNIQHPYAESGATGYEMRQLQQQNVRLRDTLVRLRDLSAHDKHEMQKMHKDLEQYKSEIAELSRTKEKLSLRVDELEAQVADLREQREAALETIMDRDSTILKFRELVQKMTEQYNETRAQLESKQGSPAPSEQESTPEPVARTSPPVDLGSLVHLSRASTRSIDLQLRALELTQARARADMLCACLPDHFMQTAGDHDAILLILLLQRLNTKAEIILGQIRERFPPVNVWDREVVTNTHTAVQYSFRCQLEYQLHMIQIRERFPPVNVWDREVVTNTHTAVQYSFRCQLEYQLHMIQCIVTMWSLALSCCTPELLLRAASALPDALQQERALDGLVQLLKTNELDENCSLDGIERCWTYLSAMWSALNLSSLEGADVAREPLLHVCSALDALARALHADASALTHILQQSDRQQELGLLHESVCTTSAQLQQQLKCVRRRLPPGVRLHAVPLDPQLVERLRGECASSLWRCARAAWLCARAACACAATAGERADGAPLPHASLLTLWAAAVDKVYQQCIVTMWSLALSCCTPELLLRAASALPDALQQERALDGLVQLLKTNELDENCSLDGKCTHYYFTLIAGWDDNPTPPEREHKQDRYQASFVTKQAYF
ncbi:hypothetical protein B5X24_HaOG209934 [Helicoverpa armigera]|uniref:Dynein associated protein domain-containing protein n=1 Tax=Helicoverpa armigera TaxID=29058 RepID=A0A2W1BDA2_HELAM|nr:hypothetical protein B5X24_HaOG209934 [Helicoverpa armigera]